MKRFLLLEKAVYSNKIFSKILSEEFKMGVDFGEDLNDDVFRLHFVGDNFITFTKTEVDLSKNFTVMICTYILLDKNKINEKNINYTLKKLDSLFLKSTSYKNPFNSIDNSLEAGYLSRPRLSYYNISYDKNSKLCDSAYFCVTSFLENIPLFNYEKMKKENKFEYEIKNVEICSLKLKKLIEDIWK